LSIVKALLLPPASLILIGLLGLWLLHRRSRRGTALIAASLGLLFVISTPLFAGWALNLLSPAYSDPREHPGAQAIVVLGGGTYGPAPEYGTDMVSRLTLMRVRYAAKLHTQSGKPILVSGGSVTGQTTAEAHQMRALLVDEFHVPVRWIEDRSHDTLTNALESYRILAPAGVTTIYLVTHAWHTRRARLAFEHAGFSVIAAPTQFYQVDDIGVHDFLPRASALLNSYYFFHEAFGYLWYALKTRI
jgi:uncharacterized SAM-binding protein YcdF (DUF218 family)